MDLMIGSPEGVREGVALLTRMHFSHSALPDSVFNALPGTALRRAAPPRASPLSSLSPARRRGSCRAAPCRTAPSCAQREQARLMAHALGGDE